MRRNNIINRIVKTLEVMKEKELELNEMELIYQITAEYGCSIRKAKEYLKVAKVQNEIRHKQTLGNS